MSESIPVPIVVNGMIAKKSATFTRSTLLVEYKVKTVPYILMMFLGIGIVFALLLSQDLRFICGGLVLGVIILLFGLSEERSYRYEFDKEHNEIRCKWVGFQGISILKREDMLYTLDDLSHIRIKQNSRREGGGFQVKAMLYNGAALNLPSDGSLAESIKAANDYREFLEIEAPVE